MARGLYEIKLRSRFADYMVSQWTLLSLTLLGQNNLKFVTDFPKASLKIIKNIKFYVKQC